VVRAVVVAESLNGEENGTWGNGGGNAGRATMMEASPVLPPLRLLSVFVREELNTCDALRLEGSMLLPPAGSAVACLLNMRPASEDGDDDNNMPVALPCAL